MYPYTCVFIYNIYIHVCIYICVYIYTQRFIYIYIYTRCEYPQRTSAQRGGEKDSVQVANVSVSVTGT